MRQTTRVLTALAALGAATVLSLAPPAQALTTSTTTLTSSANPAGPSDSITLTATVTGSAPSGTVVFEEPGVLNLGSAPVSGTGVATMVVSGLTAGTHTLTATYYGDVDNDLSFGTLTQTITGAAPAAPAPPVATVKPPKIKLKASTTKTQVGDKVRLQWRTKHAESVMASGAWSGSQKSKGWRDIRINERGKYVFKLTVKNASGAKTATVKVLATRKAKELTLVVTDELTMVGTDVEVTADGLAKGEDYTLRLDGKVLATGKADKHGDVKKSFVLAKTTAAGALPLTITGSNPGRVGTAVLNVIKPATLDVQVSNAEIPAKQDQVLTVTGMLPEEPLTVVYLGKTLTTDKADAAGTFTYTFPVGKAGERTVKVIGADPSRNGEADFTVVKPGSSGTGGGTGGGGSGPDARLLVSWF